MSETSAASEATTTTTELIYDWNEVKRRGRVFPAKVELCDETLRDGIQSPSVVDPPIETKKELIELMDKIGIFTADIGLPGAGARAVDDVRALAVHIRDNKLKLLPNCAARTVIKDIEPIVRIRDDVGIPIIAYCFLGTSPVRLLAEDWDMDRLMKSADEAISFAVKNNLECAFVTEDTTRTPPPTLDRLFRHVISIGCRRLVLCDTVGHVTPDGVKNLIDWTRDLIDGTGEDVKIDWHGHNDRGLGVPNALFALEHGADRVHGTALGVGERVGNASIDQIIVNLKLMGAYDHDVTHLVQYCRLVAEATKVDVPVNYPLVGRDAFRTATGVHAAAVIKAEKKGDKFGEALLGDVIYSGVPAGWFGREQEIEVGHMSGLSNVRYWLQKRRVTIDDEAHQEALVQAIFAKAKSSNRTLRDDEIWDIVKRQGG
ncbi:MAG: LeuA family protein [Deltaproteobacteria bacterium]|nr:LeuA family protein [Deltaproteobacteria bacterium]